MAFILLLLLFTGCSSVGDWLSGPVPHPSAGSSYPVTFDFLAVGVTTQTQVRAALGPPTDLQTSVSQGDVRETWAYAHASPAVNPLQYLPLVGVLALPQRQEPEAVAISFSSDGIVNGISVRDLQPYGGTMAPHDRQKSGRAVTPFGLNNPMIRVTQARPLPPPKTQVE